MCDHAHTATTEPRPFTSAAGERRAAQGNVSWTEICLDCGASRQVDSNAGLDHSPWWPLRWQWVGRPNSGDPGWMVGYTPQLRLVVKATRVRRGVIGLPPAADQQTPIPPSSVPDGALRYISVSRLPKAA
jgi:hypothetical protein